MSKEKIIIDTDIGDDIDDALALAFALNSPELDVIGVTTVFRNVRARARMAVRLLKLAGREDIPVYAGCGSPIINKADLNEIPIQYSADMDSIQVESEHAVDYIVRQVMASDKEITLVPIGPLTNIAAALIKEPGIKDKIKRIVLMGGAFYNHCNEWNILCDPEAARVVFDSGIEIKAVGLDVTTKCILRDEDMKLINGHKGELQIFLAELIRRWQTGNAWNPMLHDPLAVCAVFDKEILEFKQEEIAVEIRGEFTRGSTFNKSSIWRGDSVNASKTWAAREVKVAGFLDLFMGRIFK